MRKTLTAATVLLVLASAGCANPHAHSYGVTSAGRTKTSAPKDVPVPDASSFSPTPRADPLPCLFDRHQIGHVLGLQVGHVVVQHQGAVVTCTWHANESVKTPSWRVQDPVARSAAGVVSITRGPASSAREVSRTVATRAVQSRATGRQELHRGDVSGFVIGASVSGVPIWQALSMDNGLVTAVEVSGAGSRSSIATITAFLIQTVART